MPLNVTTNFIDLLKAKGMNTAPFEKYLNLGVEITVSMYKLTAHKHGKQIAAASSPTVSVQKCLPTLAAELLTQLQKWELEGPDEEPKYVGNPKSLKELSEKLIKVKAAAPPPIETMPNWKGAVLTPGAATPALSMLTTGDVMQTTPAAEGSAYPVYTPGKTKIAPVFLRHATGLYHPVKGTEGNSLYFLLADFGTLKMAGRWKGGKFSVRFESDALGKYKKTLAEMGLNVPGDFHASVHVNISSVMDARKLVYAMIGGVGPKAISPMPEVELIKDLGA